MEASSRTVLWRKAAVPGWKMAAQFLLGFLHKIVADFCHLLPHPSYILRDIWEPFQQPVKRQETTISWATQGNMMKRTPITKSLPRLKNLSPFSGASSSTQQSSFKLEVLAATKWHRKIGKVLGSWFFCFGGGFLFRFGFFFFICVIVKSSSPRNTGSAELERIPLSVHSNTTATSST